MTRYRTERSGSAEKRVNAATRAWLVLLCMLTALFCSAAVLCACSQESSDSRSAPAYEAELLDTGTLKVLTALDYPPFSAGSADEPWGYDIAVAQEVASRLGLSLEFVSVPRESIVSALACEPEGSSSEEEKIEPQADIAIAALAITPERDDRLDFSSWYYVGNQAVVTLSKAYQSTTEFDRAKARIAVVKGSTCLETAKTLTDEKLIVEYSTARKCLQALQAKEVQAVVLDLPVATYLLDHEFSGMRILEHVMTGEAYAIALPSQSQNLKEAINKTLEEMTNDGTLARLEDEYVKRSY